MKDFGVIVTCSKSDYLFAKGCCASVKYFMGDVPICLLVDGEFPTDELTETYGVSVINKSTVKHAMLAERSFGWGLTKMIAFWESPFQHFLLLDADTCVWGDIRKLVEYDQYDVVVDIPCYKYSDQSITEFFFNVNRINDYFPEFNFRQHQYVCTGVLFAKRDIFSLTEYKEILDLKDKEADLFKYGEMGFLNFMLFRAKQEGRLRVGAADIQYIVTDYKFCDTESKFPVQHIPAVDYAHTVIHWAGGDKPVKQKADVYSVPMTFFRKKFLKDKGSAPWATEVILAFEDYQWVVRKQTPYYKRRLKEMLFNR